MSKFFYLRRIKGSLPIVIISSLILAIVSVLMGWKLGDIINTHTEEFVAYESGIISQLISNSFSEELDNLNDASVFVDTETGKLSQFFKAEEGVEYGVIKINGEVTDGYGIDFTKYSGFFDALHGTPSVSSSNEEILFAVPVYSGENVKYALFKLYDSEVYNRKLNISSIGKDGRYAVVNIDGEIILEGSDSTLNSEFFNEEKNAEAVIEIKEKMNVRSSAAARSKSMGDNIIFASETEYTDMYVMGYIPTKTALGSNALIIPLVLWIFGLLWLLLVIITLYLMGAERKAQKSEEFKRAKIDAENASKAKSDFLANMSHEIRTPINAVIGMNEMILRESEDETVLEYAENIESASHSLLSIINDILDFSKIESGKMEITEHEYSLNSLLHDIITMIQIKAEQKGLAFNISVDKDTPDMLYGDDTRIKQVLVNLLNNAVKYTPKGSVKLAVDALPTKDINTVILQIAVSDTGIGIKEEDINGLFEGFQRLDMERNRHIEGTGLGLAITKRLAGLMGGDIKVASVYERGSTFTLTLEQMVLSSKVIGDFQKSEKHTRSKKYSASFTAPEANILVVDDNDMNLLVIKNLLKKTEVKVTVSKSGENALRLMREKKFDIIFLDHMMPGMDGIETLKYSKEMTDNKCENAPVIALTANAVSGVKEMYIEAGFDDYLSKPVDGNTLEQLIVKYLPKKLVSLKDTDESPKEEKTAEATALVNYTLGLSYCANDKGLYAEIAKMFIEDMDEKKAELEGFIEAEDWKNYTINIHGLKTNSLNIGAETLSKKCLELEFAGKSIQAGENTEEKISFIRSNHPEALELYKKTIDELKKYL